ncbi:gastrula zinc finger protein xFG20-1-like [Copidosoma floridanum]|uniref:gastrula zinc finger protein xFG20-1-like n=1 Tax=Copidosoma floridanum TaxID=29053 RepID=UPI0006C93F31|nr:gastrula zinc finger protein xFG20-1-like [Copidosoma floridanum]
MGQGTESSETCADRPTEVSVIRFVSKNHTIEEIAPKKEIYICNQRGCGKIFTNQEEYKNHEVMESLKVKFVCSEPGCGKELTDPGRMWWHYQEWHNNDTSVFVCPYTNCGSVHATNENLQEHIESSHRQLPRIPTEPEIICFEGTDTVMEDDICDRLKEEEEDEEDPLGAIDCGKMPVMTNEYVINEDGRIASTKQVAQPNEDCSPKEQSKLRAALSGGDYSKNETVTSRAGTTSTPSSATTTTTTTTTTSRFPKNKDLLITKENFLAKYEARSPISNNESILIDSSQDGGTIFISSDVSLTKTTGQEHRIDLGNLEKVFRNGFERDSPKTEDNQSKINCSDDEEYTPKKQRISRSKQEPKRCEINGCGKTYKNRTSFRHHQDSHLLINNANATKTQKHKIEKATTISFFICKRCGTQLSNAAALCKHYQETHTNNKPQPTSTAKSTEVHRCKVSGCEAEFATSSLLSKHLNELHAKNSANNANSNIKTGNGSGVMGEQMFRENDATAQRANLKTELKAKHSLVGLNEFADGKDKNSQSQNPVDKDDSGD